MFRGQIRSEVRTEPGSRRHCDTFPPGSEAAAGCAKAASFKKKSTKRKEVFTKGHQGRRRATKGLEKAQVGSANSRAGGEGIHPFQARPAWYTNEVIRQHMNPLPCLISLSAGSSE